jgi:uncharacterized membrane protein YhaH (DUF805 family)
MELMLQPLRKYAEFTGRARRAEYWLYTLGLYVVIGVLAGLIMASNPAGAGVNPVGSLLALLMLAVGLGTLVPSLAVGFRRLHDIDKSAWWLLIALVPLIGPIVLLVFTLLPGTAGPNRFGPDPKATLEGGEAVSSVVA